MAAHASRGHAKLSPSASKRWMTCPGSIRESAGIAQSSSAYADEGTAAHELAQLCFNSGKVPSAFIGRYVDLDAKSAANRIVPDKRPSRCFLVDDEMVDAVQTYTDYVTRIAGEDGTEVSVEQWLTLEHLGIPGLDGGTGDFIAYCPSSKVLHVVDFKYGRGVPVFPQENTQGLCYALGAVMRYHNRGLSKIVISIVQPRCPQAGDSPAGVRTWETDALSILDFESELKAAALRTVDPDAPLCPGEHCKFCPAAHVCTARREQAMAIAQAEFSPVTGEIELAPPDSFAPEQLSKILRDITQVEDWCRRVREYAHAEATHGRCPPGFKLVANRATRRWKDEDGVIAALKKIGLSKDEMFVEPKLKSPAQIEPLCPGKNKIERAKVIADLVSKESSGTVLAVESDPRPPVRADASEFGETNG